MDLKRKLARLRGAGPGSLPRRAPEPAPVDALNAPPVPIEPEPLGDDDVERRARVTKLRSLLGSMMADEKRRLRDRAPTVTPPQPLPGVVEETAFGRLRRVSAYLEPAHVHGRVGIARAIDVDAETIGKLALDDELAGVDPTRLLYLDTETTGLAGGAGTIPFLIGIAWFEDESMHLEQLVLERPGEEAPMLRRLAERIAWASAVVSYNGKSYDWPLLRSRFVLNRVPVATPAAHVDLLHCARRVFKRRLGHVRLVHMEEHVLGMRREGDIDGAEIPQRFWDFVRGSDGSLLAPIIEHNANDIVALAAILVSLVERYEQLRPEHEPEDRLGVAEVALRAADPDRAARYAESAADAGGSPDLTCDALWLASELARKRGDTAARLTLLQRALEVSTDPRRTARAHLALAKIHEHTHRDFETALLHARSTDHEEGTAARDHRVARLLRKIEKVRRQRRLEVS
ncbi:MAG: ribonuclease H-like domain-containing protein [Sandaracinaceae bacterium]